MTEKKKSCRKRLIDNRGIELMDVELNSVYLVIQDKDDYHYTLMDDKGKTIRLAMDRFEDIGLEFTTGPGVKKDNHYDNSNGSLYLFAEQHQLNAWEFDIIKRITRCRKKGQFKEDLEKTKRVIDLYLKEYEQ